LKKKNFVFSKKTLYFQNQLYFEEKKHTDCTEVARKVRIKTATKLTK